MMKSQNFMFLESSKTQKYKYLEDEGFFSPQLKEIFILYTVRTT